MENIWGSFPRLGNYECGSGCRGACFSEISPLHGNEGACMWTCEGLQTRYKWILHEFHTEATYPPVELSASRLESGYQRDRQRKNIINNFVPHLKLYFSRYLLRLYILVSSIRALNVHLTHRQPFLTLSVLERLLWSNYSQHVFCQNISDESASCLCLLLINLSLNGPYIQHTYETS